MYQHSKIFSISLLSAALLTACGGSGSDTATPVTPATPLVTAPTMFSGLVIDGYIEGAKVCLDLNANQACDSGEPSTTSLAGGKYSLDVSALTTAQIKAAHLLTIVPDTAKDADDGGKTLKEASKSGFSLMAPASAFVNADGKTLSSAVISPITTLVSHDMIVGNNKPLADAQAAVVQRMGLPAGTDLQQDFVDKKNDSLKKQAQVVAASIAEVSKTIKAGSSTTSDRDALLAALSYVQQNVAALEKSVEGAAAGKSISDNVKTALTTPALKPVVSTLVNDAKTISTSTAVDISAVLATGFYGNCLLECTPQEYSKISGTDGKWTSDRYQIGSTTWVPVTTTTSQDYGLGTTGWAPESKTGTVTPDGSNGATVTRSDSNISFRVTTRSIDVSGKRAGDVAGLNAPTALASTVFPAGSIIYWMQNYNNAPEYRLYTGNAIPNSAQTTSLTPTSLTSLDALRAAYPPLSATSYATLQWDNVRFTFDAGGTATGGKVTFYPANCASASANNNCSTSDGTGTYSVTTVNGQQVMVIDGRAKNESANSSLLFSVYNGKVYGGTYNKPGAYSNARPHFNGTAMKAVLSALGLPTVVN